MVVLQAGIPLQQNNVGGIAMKKIMVAILFLIPLIIIMTVNVSGLIISATVKISVESIILKNRAEIIDNVYINFNEYRDVNKYYKIDAVTYPKIAWANLGWSTSDLNVAYVDKGKVFFVGYGDVTITCYSLENININARVNFYVSGDTIYSVNIIEYGEENISDAIDLAIYDRKLLDKVIVPANALKDKVINWSSSNPDAVSVDGNGVITGKSIGTSAITMSITEDDIIHSDTVTINVLPAYKLLKTNSIVIGSSSVNLADYAINDDFIITNIQGNATFDSTTVTHTGSSVEEVIVTVSQGGIESEITIQFTDGLLLLGFLNYDVLSSTIWNLGNYVWAGSACFKLDSVVMNNDYQGLAPNVQWYSSDTDVIEVVSGRLHALQSGSATITLSANGFVSAELHIEVKAPMESVSLELDNLGDKRGIEGKRVFGIKSYHYNEQNVPYIDNTFELKVSSYRPLDAEQVYDYRSSNTDYATVDVNGIITFYEEGIGNSVIIYITARYSVSARPVSDYYEFHLVNGVNIGLNVNPADNTDDNPDCTIYDELKSVLSVETQDNAVLHTNVYYPTRGEGGGSITAYADIYGNGYKIDAQFMEKDFSTSMFGINYSFERDELVFNNVTLNSGYPTDDFTVYLKNGGTMFIIGASDEIVGNKRFVVRYSIMQYSYCHMYVHGGKVTLDGCVVRNTAGPTINSDNSEGHAPDITVNNCIFSNTIAPIITIYSYFNLSDNPPLSKYSSLRLTGKNYIYNWKDIQNIKVDIVPENAMPNNLGTVFNNSINKAVRQELKQSKFDVLKVDAKDPVTGFNKSYVNFSILIVGVWRDASHFNLHYDRDDFVNIELDVSSTDIGKILGKTAYNNPCYLLTPQNPDGIPTTLPNEDYELNEITLSRLRGN